MKESETNIESSKSNHINQTNIKCIKEKCPFYYQSNIYQETCYLTSKYKLLDKCYGIMEIPNKKEIIACQISELLKELDCLEETNTLIMCNQI